jgi:hypothetical protein
MVGLLINNLAVVDGHRYAVGEYHHGGANGPIPFAPMAARLDTEVDGAGSIACAEEFMGTVRVDRTVNSAGDVPRGSNLGNFRDRSVNFGSVYS